MKNSALVVCETILLPASYYTQTVRSISTFVKALAASTLVFLPFSFLFFVSLFFFTWFASREEFAAKIVPPLESLLHLLPCA
jgi:hypothetical protein